MAAPASASGRRMHQKRKTRHHLCAVGTTLSLRRAGVKGKAASVEVANHDRSTIILQGEKRGRIEFAVADIRYLRAAIEYGKTTHHRCVIARERGSDVVFDSTWSYNYEDLVLHIAAEMAAIGRFDRVQRGLRWWESLIHLVIFGGICATLLYAPYDMYRLHGARWEQQDFLIATGLGLTALFGLLFVVGLWYRWYRPQRARDMEDLSRVLV